MPCWMTKTLNSNLILSSCLQQAPVPTAINHMSTEFLLLLFILLEEVWDGVLQNADNAQGKTKKNYCYCPIILNINKTSGGLHSW